MSISIAQFKDIILSKSGGKPLSKVANIYSLIWQAMMKVKMQVDLPSALRTVQLTNPVYSDIHIYPMPGDVSLNAIVNVRPLTPNDNQYDFANINQRQFTIEEKFNPDSPRYGVRNINGVQYLLVNDVTTSPTVIQSCDSLTASGVVTAVGSVSNVATDALNKKVGGASFTFSIGASSSNGLQGTLLTAVDLSTLNDFYAYIFLPNTTNLTGIKYSVGQNASNYYSGSIATDFFGNALTTGWNFVRIPKANFIAGAGVPTYTGVLYWKFEILGTFTSIVPGYYFDNFVANNGALYEIDYYSEYQFQDITGARMAKPSADTDNILIAGDEIDLFTDQFIELMTVDLKQQGAGMDRATYGASHLKGYTRYGGEFGAYLDFKIKHPSQRQLMVTKYGSRPNLL